LFNDPIVHWYRNIFSHLPSTKLREIVAMLKAIHASEDVVAAREKAIRVMEKLLGFRLTKAGELAEAGVEETLTYYAFPEEHWRRIRTTDVIDKPFVKDFLEFVGDLVSFCGTGDCVAKSKAGGCEPCRAALARSSVAAPVRLGFGRCGCHWLTRRS
jgi:Transposase, Mutator family